MQESGEANGRYRPMVCCADRWSHFIIFALPIPFDIAGIKYDVEYEKHIVELLALESRLKFYPTQLSGGEKQRATIARALIRKPAIILADEPNGNIDSETSKNLMEYVKRTNQEFNQTYLIVTHDKAWLDYANRSYEMLDGRFI